MSIADSTPGALALAHALADAGAPVFSGRIDEDGNPDRMDKRWAGWDHAPVGRRAHTNIDRWRPGQAMAMVTGSAYDVIDVDPRNGGMKSFKKLSDELGDNGPDIYLQTRTPSGGLHLFISPMGIGTHHPLPGLPGVDLQGGKDDGTSRAFVFIPPTERPDKRGTVHDLRPYSVKQKLHPFNGHNGNTKPLLEILRKYAKESIKEAGRVDRSRQPPNELRKEVMAAEAGQQRAALLRYIHELERCGYERDDIVTLCVSLDITNFDRRRPWRESDFRNLLHKEGEVIGDALPGELDGIANPMRVGLVRSMADVADEIISWLWDMMFPVGDFVMMDGEKGQGKTFAVMDVAARGSRGDPMPGADKAIVAPFNTLYLTYEGQSAVRPRLLAAKADMSRIFMPNLERPKRRGEQEESDPFALPYGAERIGRMIRESDAKLIVLDPVADFLSSDIQTHNDASVRMALRPLGDVIRREACSGLMIRHMNKRKDADARFRGTGTSAFQNRARVHLIVGELPGLTEEGDRQFAIGMADANDTKRIGGALSYRVIDSDINLDDRGRKVGKVEWQGYVDVDVNTLSRGPSLDGDLGRRGPIPIAQESVVEVLEALFLESDGYSIPAGDCIKALREAGCSTSPAVLAKARKQMGIRTVRERVGEYGKVVGWFWVMR
jgi:hypothetical protein